MSLIYSFNKIFKVNNLNAINTFIRASNRFINTVNDEQCTKERLIQSTIENNFQPVYFKIINESFMHNVPKGSETHFRIVIVSKEFESLSLVNRHRIVNTALSDLLKSIHALAIEAYTPAQWQASDQTHLRSPLCRGGDKSKN